MDIHTEFFIEYSKFIIKKKINKIHVILPKKIQNAKKYLQNLL